MKSFNITCTAFQLPYILQEMEKADRAGLAFGGQVDTEPQFIGTDSEWDKYNDELDIVDEQAANDVKS